MSTTLPEGHVQVDWSKWSPPGEGDVRSPCPAINSLANHNILPHNGKGITKEMAVEALTKSYNIDPHIANVFSGGAVKANPDQTTQTFDLNHLDKHGYIEHDVSLSRNDIAFGSNSNFDRELFDEILECYRKESGDMTNWKSAGHVRYERVKQSKARHEKEGKPWLFGLKENIMSYGETSLYLNLLGKDGVAPVEWVKIFFQEERLPVTEGWQPPPKLDQSMLNHGYAEMVKAQDHKFEEAKIVGQGTVEAIGTTIMDTVSSFLGMSHPHTYPGDPQHFGPENLKGGHEQVVMGMPAGSVPDSSQTTRKSQATG